MDSIAAKYYIADNIIFESNTTDKQFNNSEFQFYEVIRTVDGVCLFLTDHLNRLKESLLKVNLLDYYNETEVDHCIHLLINKNNRLSGNIKLLCKTSKNNRLIYASYYIPHSYPSPEMYLTGVKLKSYVFERDQPNLKQISVNEIIKREIQSLVNSDNCYEVLLINNRGEITEGSKSNFFFIKGNTVYSAPEDQILKGITRKYIIQIIRDLSLTYIETSIPYKNISSYDAAFISGTSPKVLPVYKIDTQEYNPNNICLKEIRESFDLLFKQNIELQKNNKK